MIGEIREQAAAIRIEERSSGRPVDLFANNATRHIPHQCAHSVDTFDTSNWEAFPSIAQIYGERYIKKVHSVHTLKRYLEKRYRLQIAILSTEFRE